MSSGRWYRAVVSRPNPGSRVLPILSTRFRAPWTIVASLCLLTGCATTPVPSKPAAHLVVNNLTDYRWRIEIRRPTGNPVRDLQLVAQSSQSVDLEGSDYVIEQSAQAEGAPSNLSRSISVRLEPGQTYVWRLATLLSGQGGPEGQR